MSSSCTANLEMNTHSKQGGSPHSNIRQVIGVTSAKGGVGKSFVTGLLAIELARKGYTVGILDADFNGSSIPSLFGLKGPIRIGQYSFLPLQTPSEIKVISPDFLVEDDTKTVIWKEAFSSNVIAQIYKEVEWGSVDYMIVDLPPATSEVAVSMMQAVPFTGIVMVTQPQELCTKLVARAIRIVQEIGVTILGIVENMSYYFNPEVDEKGYLFGRTQPDSLSASAKAPVLARLPFTAENLALCDRGKIEEISLPESETLCKAFIDALAIYEKTTAACPISEVGNSGVDEHQGLVEQDELDSSQETTHDGQYFSDIVIQLIRNKDNVGSMRRPDAQGHYLGKCGDRMQIDLQIVDRRILNAKFTAEGCGATLACGSMITKMACSKTLEEAEHIRPDDLITAVGGLPDDHLHCAELAIMTLREAVIDAIEGHGIARK